MLAIVYKIERKTHKSFLRLRVVHNEFLKQKDMFTKDELQRSKEYKEWVNGNVAVIHDTYYDSKDNYSAWIVIHSEMGKWTITRFFKMNERIQVSVDYTDISTIEVFNLLLSKYSRGLS